MTRKECKIFHCKNTTEISFIITLINIWVHALTSCLMNRYGAMKQDIQHQQTEGQETETYSSNVWGVKMLQQTVHLFDSKLHGEELV